MRQVRIGIDVGGTFTDAVAIDNATYEIIAQEKIPTTHDAKEGVAEGIITILQNILQKTVAARYGGEIDSQELCLPVCSGGVLPCGATGRWLGER